MRIEDARVENLLSPSREVKINRTSLQDEHDFLMGVGVAFPEGMVKRYTHEVDQCVLPYMVEVWGIVRFTATEMVFSASKVNSRCARHDLIKHTAPGCSIWVRVPVPPGIEQAELEAMCEPGGHVYDVMMKAAELQVISGLGLYAKLESYWIQYNVEVTESMARYIQRGRGNK